MLDTGVKTLCTLCTHKEVCTYKQDYLDFIKAIENATMNANSHDFISTISDNLGELTECIHLLIFLKRRKIYEYEFYQPC